MRFDPDIEGFPFPASNMNGGWTMAPKDDQKNRVQVWFEFTCKNFLIKAMLPILGAAWLLSFRKVVRNMDRGE